MTLDLAFRLREMVAFDGVPALLEQMSADVERARRLLAASRPRQHQDAGLERLLVITSRCRPTGRLISVCSHLPS